MATLEHPSGLLAQVSCSFGTAVYRHALIAGTAGVIQTSYLNNPPTDDSAALQLRRGVSWEAGYQPVPVAALNGFQAEMESFERLVRLGPEHWSGASPAESLDIALALDAIIESARTKRAVDIDR